MAYLPSHHPDSTKQKLKRSPDYPDSTGAESTQQNLEPQLEPKWLCHISATLPPHYRTTPTSPLHCRHTTATSPLHYRHTTATSPPHYRHTTATLPPHLRHTTATSPPHYRHTTATLPPHLRHTTATSPPHNRIQPPHLCHTAATYPIVIIGFDVSRHRQGVRIMIDRTSNRDVDHETDPLRGFVPFLTGRVLPFGLGH